MSRFDTLREPERREPESASAERQARQLYPDRDRSVRLNDAELRSLRAVGAFRSVEARELPKASVRRLIEAGLVQRSAVYARRGGERLEVLTLTNKGRDLVCSQQGASDAQRYWSGIVKPRELEHDLAIWRAYASEAATITREGGRVRRVVLDYELKSHINARMNRAAGPEKAARRKELADEYALPVINDQLALPDLRIEYTDAEGREQHRDIEVTTRHYRGAHRAAKMRSGFRLHDAGSPRAAVRDDHHLGWL
jgi:hypothetical protein